MSRPLLLDNIESRILRGGDKMTGALQLKGAPTSDLEAATKKYVDDNTPDTANAAKKLAQARNLAVSDNDGSNTGPATSFDGTANATMKLPATIKASLTGNASSASKLTTTSAGSSQKPVYFASGIPQECGSELAVSVTGNAATATLANEATHAVNADNATNATEAAHAATADSATNATTAGTCTGNAATATRLASSTAVGSTTAPIYFSNGVPQPCGDTLAVAISGKAASADKLNANAGSTTLPVYFDAGIPKACNTDLAVNVTGSSGSCTGNAATATALKTARNFSIADNDGTNTGPTASFNGTANAIINLPSTIKATLNGNATSATTATKLATARTISLTGDVTGSGSFDGSGNLSIATTVADNSHSHSYLPLSGGSMTGRITTIYGTPASSIGNMYTTAAIQIRENNIVGSAQSDILYAPTLGFHWSGRVACNLSLHSDGALYLYNNSGILSTFKAGSVYGAVWNDYAEFRNYKDSAEIPYGKVVIENGDDSLSLSTERLQKGGNIVSDTFGFAIGETDDCKLPIAVSGRALVYTNEDRYSYDPGDAVCTGPNGTISRMTEDEIRNYPDRIIGYVSAIPEYETWGTGNVKVNGRIWIKVI